MIRFIIISLAAIALLIVALPPAASSGQPQIVLITDLRCAGDDEYVQLEAPVVAVTMDGWQLVSLNGGEVFDFATQAPGTTLQPATPFRIASGPAASGDIVWTSDEIWDEVNGDTAEIINPDGEVIDSLACPGAPTIIETPPPGVTPQPTPEPTPTPTVGATPIPAEATPAAPETPTMATPTLEPAMAERLASPEATPAIIPVSGGAPPQGGAHWWPIGLGAGALAVAAAIAFSQRRRQA